MRFADRLGDSDSDSEYESPASPNSNLAPSPPLRNPAMSDPTSAGTAAGIEERMARIEEALLGLLGQNQLNNNSPAPVPAVSAPAEGPGLFA